MKLKDSKLFPSLFIFAFMLLLGNSSFGQCSMCRKIATDGANSNEVANSLNFGIIYLLALPYTLLFFFFRKQIFAFFRSLLSK